MKPLLYRDLSDVLLKELIEVFNQSFKDYFIPINMDAELFNRKINLEDIDLKYSIGCFDDKKLIAFVLHGKRNTVLYNAGTGVLPEYRGNKITQQMYQYFFNTELIKHISRVELEVIDKNYIAVSNYRNISFNQTDTVQCFSLTLKAHLENNKANVSESEVPADFNVENFINSNPLWQNNILSKEDTFSYLKFITVQKQNEIVAYALFNTLNNRLLQIGTHPNFRKQGLATCLLQFIAQNYCRNISVINSSITNTTLLDFLRNHNATHTITQYQMVKSIR
ncbi:MAG TPA: hypothetical protein PLC61_07525 [Chitinophagales bacterium]|nr:GNAT family N-acetyltransferase [Chitinophagales bacterium]HMZ95096.1 hypothetical protein [Chitinophagales bacterium]HNC65144.1 hypothetical protein [Chitinophagales bacterium]HND46224.1 hypothetical protein [Chitinophagales bacterium]HNE87619.1 hypothetical protein [Chitinophagales bacterium]